MTRGNGNRGVSVVPALLATSVVLFICMIGAYVFKPDAPTHGVDAMPGTLPQADGIDPEPFRTAITALEAILYQEAPADYGTGEQVAAIAQRLAVGVRGSGIDRRRQAAFGELFDWAGRVDARASTGYASTDLPRLRREWEVVRGCVFAPADWFAESEAQLNAAQTPVSPALDPAAVRRLDVAANRIETMIRRGRRRALSIPEASVDAGLSTSGARDATQRWNEFARGWTESVDEMSGALPEHPGWDADSNVLMAYQELGQALNELRNVTWSAASTTNIPFKYEREGHFDSAENRVETARQHLGKLNADESY